MEYLIILGIILVNGLQVVAFVLYPYYSINLGRQGRRLLIRDERLFDIMAQGRALIRGSVGDNKKSSASNFGYSLARMQSTGVSLVGTLSNLDDELSGRRAEVFSRSRQLLRMSVMSSTWRSGRDIC